MIFKKQLFLTAATVLFVNALFAQNKQYTMDEATNGIYTTLAPKGLSGASWEPGTNKLYHILKADKEQYWVSISYPSGRVDTILTLSDLNKSIDREKAYTSLPSLHWIDKGLVWIKDGKDLKQGIISGDGMVWSKWVSVHENAANITVDKYQNVAYTVDNNLYMVTRDRQTKQVTN
ncbi:MAG: hypothetical protein H6551_07295, partial [Chitinophagales bacterium]|nr:hypothetical protein [Chitinophagales bacterium]